MRRVLLGAIAAGLLIVAGGQAALAKGAPGEEGLQGTPVIDPAPRGLKPGQPWDATIRFVQDGRPTGLAGYRPIVQLHDLSTTDVINVTAFATPAPGRYTARIVFPHAGEWSIVVKSLETGVAATTAIRIARPAAAPPALGSPAHHVPVWSWAAAGALTLLIVGAALLLAPARRRQRVAAG